MSLFDEVYSKWLSNQIAEEKNPRRRELLNKGLGHGTVTFLRSIWFPAIGNLDHLYPEYEVRDFNNGCRYLDLAYMPQGSKGCIEIQDFRTHARDIESGRFKDLCMKQALLALDDWLFLPIAYLSIRDDPGICKQMTLSFVGKFLSATVPSELDWAEAESIRFASRLMRPFMPRELSAHLRLSERHTRSILHRLVNKKLFVVASGDLRYRTYRLGQAPRAIELF
ncbi:transcriptional regulator [Paenibacillus sp. LHD-117]|uniref:transcriptional regulator n=1 Tax=Paenibacillus sp. LHD-117 TaxID=3071412 RepID=UPI0027E1F52D|nr:transcriptional regulator [Paenibacillus sp. LHD-117]MDQ6423486.1 transcriptional regulator [Paenibacillus sp. LHD-117]